MGEFAFERMSFLKGGAPNAVDPAFVLAASKGATGVLTPADGGRTVPGKKKGGKKKGKKKGNAAQQPAAAAAAEEELPEVDPNQPISVVKDAEQLNRVDLNQQLRNNLSRFWEVHGIDYALFWLMMPGDERLAFVQAVVPDIKTTSTSEDPTDLLFPELNMELLEAQMGKGMVAVMQTRASKEPTVEQADLAHCKKLDKAGKMPIFSGMEVAGREGDAFQGDLAFVLDDGRIVVCPTDKSEEEKAESRRMIAEGKVTDANQFITTNVRRTVLLQFCCGLADQYLEEKQLMPAGNEENDRIRNLEAVLNNVALSASASAATNETVKTPP